MKNSHHRMKHEQQKAIRAAQKEEYKTEDKKMKEEEVKKYTTSPRKAKIKRGKARPERNHKKASPNEITWETEPESIHKEGSNWIQNIQKKTLEKASRFQKKMQKLNFIKKKK